MIIAIGAAVWFALVVPLAAWLETRRQRRTLRQVDVAPPVPAERRP